MRLKLLRMFYEFRALEEKLNELSPICKKLQDEKSALIAAAKNATEAAIDARTKAQEALDRENRALQELVAAVKQTANFAALEGGAKQSIYPGIGPDRPEPKYKAGNMPAPMATAISASKLAGVQRRNFLQEYLAEELKTASAE